MTDLVLPASLALWLVLAHAAWQRRALPHAMHTLPQALLAGAGLCGLAWSAGVQDTTLPALALAASAFAWPLLALRQARRPQARRRAFAPSQPAHSGSFGR